MEVKHVPYVVSIPTLTGSFISAVACLITILCYVVFPPKRHYRHALIINLMIADFLNSTDNAISGAFVLADKGRPVANGPQCIANGFIAQMTVQTVDFSILAIALSVFFAVRRAKFMQEPTHLQAIAVCVATWVPGVITSFVALGLGYYGSVSGNWCWLKQDLLMQRYLLTHGWRIAIFFICVLTYTYVYYRLRRLYRRRIATATQYRALLARCRAGTDYTLQRDHIMSPSTLDSRKDSGNEDVNIQRYQEAALHVGYPNANAVSPETMEAGRRTDEEKKTKPTTTDSTEKRIKEMLLLNGYPIGYIIFWIPGLMNRFWESSQGKAPEWLNALQATTQFVGLANALTYGWNEALRHRISQRYR